MHGLKLQGATPKTSPAARHYEHDTPPLIETFQYVNVATQQNWFFKFTRFALQGRLSHRDYEGTYFTVTVHIIANAIAIFFSPNISYPPIKKDNW